MNPAGKIPGAITACARAIAILAIKTYRLAISPLIAAVYGPACRFEPSCSEYAETAIARHGLIRGGAMAARRLARCHPMGSHGYDPVPPHLESPGKLQANSRKDLFGLK